jgi:hypothetical protein
MGGSALLLMERCAHTSGGALFCPSVLAIMRAHGCELNAGAPRQESAQLFQRGPGGPYSAGKLVRPPGPLHCPLRRDHS